MNYYLYCIFLYSSILVSDTTSQRVCIATDRHLYEFTLQYKLVARHERKAKHHFYRCEEGFIIKKLPLKNFQMRMNFGQYRNYLNEKHDQHKHSFSL